MNYYARYGLEWNPFLKNSKEVIIESNDYKEAMVRLDYLKEAKGFGLITGGPGKGKTTIIRNWINSLNKSLYKVVYISISTLTVLEFYRQLAIELGIESYHKKNQNYNAIQEFINRLVIEKRITPVIVIDEANYISSSILNDLKMLFNFEVDSKDRAIILLVGLPQINNTLRLNSHEPLRQRIIVNYQLEGLNKQEARDYILNKLSTAGCKQEVFEANALEAIINSAGGVSRIINKICDNCLLIANSLNSNTISTDIVIKAVDNIELS
jgi:type II secretory pathway predicted ATPase ExeA